MELRDYFSKVEESSNWVSARISTKPQLALVLSGGFDGFIDGMEVTSELSAKDIPNFPTSGAEGHSGRIIFGSYLGTQLVALVGRFHFYEGHEPSDVVFPYFVLRKLGVNICVTTNAVGGINASYKPGDIMLVSDHINFMGVNPLRGIAIQRATNQFTDMTNAYDADLRTLAREVAAKQQLDLKEGVFIATAGPSYETRAEVRALRIMGADAVGMSTVPEVIAANFLGIRVLAFSCIANLAADLHAGGMSHAEVLAAMKGMAPKAVKLLQGVIERLKEI